MPSDQRTLEVIEELLRAFGPWREQQKKSDEPQSGDAKLDIQPALKPDSPRSLRD
jgi:hypothetical protein